MTQKGTPNPAELFEAATRETRKIIAGVKSHQLSKPTPCTEWNVQALVDHLVGGASMLAGALSGAEPSKPSPARSSLAAYDDAVAAAAKAARAPGALDKKVQGLMGQMPGGQLTMGTFVDHLVHGWDLAKATEQPARLDPKLAEQAYEFLTPMVGPARGAKLFGPEVRVPANASIQDRLLGLSGRKP